MTPLSLLLGGLAVAAAAALLVLVWRGRHRPTPPAATPVTPPPLPPAPAPRRATPTYTGRLDPFSTGPLPRIRGSHPAETTAVLPRIPAQHPAEQVIRTPAVAPTVIPPSERAHVGFMPPSLLKPSTPPGSPQDDSPTRTMPPQPAEGRHAALVEGGGNVLPLLRSVGAITHSRTT